LDIWGNGISFDEDTQIPDHIKIQYSEPSPQLVKEGADTKLVHVDTKELLHPPKPITSTIAGLVQRFGDHVDTDAIIPAEFMPGTSDEDLGSHCFQYVKPEFRDKAQQGFSIVVAGFGFGSGSSREEAPRALLGCGIKAVIARNFAFIYARNQPNMSLLGITLTDDRFYELAQEGAAISIDVRRRLVRVRSAVHPDSPDSTAAAEDPSSAGWTDFAFGLSIMEERLIGGGGVTEMYKKYKRGLFRVAMMAGVDSETVDATADGCSSVSSAKGTEKSCGEAGLSW
jgi:homoaconitate hydratase